ncbi:MAG: hypothetical protein ACJ8ER_13910 [Allosphingosinicella sp.]
MSGIDRRTLFAAAGAGLVLAGCDSKAKKQQMGMVGTCALHGQSVTDTGPEVMGDVKSFAPDRICIVYLQFVAGLMRVRRTYVDIAGTSPTDSTIQAQILGELARVSKWDPATTEDTDDIHPIRLGGQRILVIYVNNKQEYIRFAYRRGGTTTPQEEKESYTHTVRFTEFSGQNPEERSRIIRKNHAFFNIRKIALLTAPTVEMEATDALFLDYWNTAEYGDKINADKNNLDTWYIYSMNIKLEMATPDPNRWVPVIVDPDTGNMGAEP